MHYANSQNSNFQDSDLGLHPLYLSSAVSSKVQDNRPLKYANTHQDSDSDSDSDILHLIRTNYDSESDISPIQRGYSYDSLSDLNKSKQIYADSNFYRNYPGTKILNVHNNEPGGRRANKKNYELFNRGDYVKIKSGQGQHYVGYITDVNVPQNTRSTNDITYTVKVGKMIKNQISDINEYKVKGDLVERWKTTKTQKMMFHLKSTGTNIYSGIFLSKIAYFFFELAGLFYNFTLDTQFVLFRSQNLEKEEKKELNTAFSENENKEKMQLKHVIQIRDNCPQYWKKIAYELSTAETPDMGYLKYKRLNIKGFDRVFFRPGIQKSEFDTIKSDNTQFYIAIYELTNRKKIPELV